MGAVVFCGGVVVLEIDGGSGVPHLYTPHFCIRIEAIGESEHLCSLIARTATKCKSGPWPINTGCCYALIPLRGRLHGRGACRNWCWGPSATCSKSHALVESCERWTGGTDKDGGVAGPGLPGSSVRLSPA